MNGVDEVWLGLLSQIMSDVKGIGGCVTLVMTMTRGEGVQILRN